MEGECPRTKGKCDWVKELFFGKLIEFYCNHCKRLQKMDGPTRESQTDLKSVDAES